MNPYFEQLGQIILEQWQKHDLSLAAFPELTKAALEKSPPSAHIDLEELIHEFLSNNNQPPQGHSGFGQPELIAFNSEHFYIQILFWMEGTTKIHQHGFSGAFHVMHGSSVHSEFEFLNPQSISPNLSTGDLSLKQIDLLDAGTTVPITSGNKCIHSLFHLESPSVTIVVRTHHDQGSSPQFNYLPPHIAIDPLHEDPLTDRRSQLLDVLDRINTNDYTSRVAEMIQDLDFESGFTILYHTMPRLIELEAWESILSSFETKHGTLAKGIAATLKESLRREYITQLRYHIEHPEHRFFLALLMNTHNRKDIFSLVAERYPDQAPADTIIRWAEELVEQDLDNLTLLDAAFPEEIEADLDNQFELLINTLAQALNAETAEQPEILDALTNSCLSPLFS